MSLTENNALVIGVDLGGTNIRIGKIKNFKIERLYTQKISAKAEESIVLNEIIRSIENVFEPGVVGIGVGVPSVIDLDKGIVYDVQNIPSWRAVPLRDVLRDRFQVPVFMNNDANCFAVGEKYFGKGKNYSNFIGLIMGTGFGAGLMIHNKLYTGRNCGAGEFGMIPYRDHNYEYYCSGQFFHNAYRTSGEALFKRANDGDKEALRIFDEFGCHVGNAFKTMLFTIDPEAIIIGGSVSKAYPYFGKSMQQVLDTFPYSIGAANIKIELSSTENVAVLGAAALYFDQKV